MYCEREDIGMESFAVPGEWSWKHEERCQAHRHHQITNTNMLLDLAELPHLREVGSSSTFDSLDETVSLEWLPPAPDSTYFNTSLATSPSRKRQQGEQAPAHRYKHLEAPLPLDFRPDHYSVVCGRGKKPPQNIGNRRLQVLAKCFLPKYVLANSKQEKTVVVTEIIDTMRAACKSDSNHAFIRQVDGEWWMVTEQQAREKVGTVMRNLLSSRYSSSSKSKAKKAREKRRFLGLSLNNNDTVGSDRQLVF